MPEPNFMKFGLEIAEYPGNNIRVFIPISPTVNLRVRIIFAQCGCKSLRTCYKDMLEALQGKDEVACIEDSSIGASTLMVYFKAVTQYCGEVIQVKGDDLTFEGRNLYEVIINNPKDKKTDKQLPVIVIDAGQDAGAEPVELAMYLIEQLVACRENNDMISNAQWVVAPSANPDGMEYARFFRPLWKKNTRILDDGLSYGVDISRNFDVQWQSCEKVKNSFSNIYPGPKAGSENETKFLMNVIRKYQKVASAYLSIRGDGHAILYPHAYRDITSKPSMEVAANIAAKVSQRGSSVQAFVDDSIYNMNGKGHCGHSVDFAIDAGILLAFEMRVFHSNDLDILSKFQKLPNGYHNTLQNSYFSGIKELYNILTNDKKKKKKDDKM